MDTGKLHSVEEIEAKIFGSNKSKPIQSKETEAAAFKQMVSKFCWNFFIFSFKKIVNDTNSRYN